MRHNQLVPFKVSDIDSLGQGVSKVDGKITFIPKTAVGDSGLAQVLSRRKGVSFGKVERFEERGLSRIEPACPHYQECPSCHFQHLGYEEELRFKEKSFERLLYGIPHPEIIVTSAPRRFEYRNRIQLHYDLRSRRLGMLAITENKIVPVPECLIGLPPLKEEVRRLYEGDRWLKEVPGDRPTGHVEIYYLGGEIKLSWNRPYAEGGFTQVFQEMNEELRKRLARWFEGLGSAPPTILDLFAGNGNLSGPLGGKRLCVDLYSKPPGSDFFSQDLYTEGACARVAREIRERSLDIELVLIDPPRSGLKGLEDWIRSVDPEYIAYVSCDPHTLVRDIKPLLSSYAVVETHLFDFFPATYHFESALFLRRRG